jgi:uncharacterized protein (TIGR02996 family)
MTPDGEALVASVLARPDDDAPRLVYADWLEENGDPDRAELIRVQCELSTWDPAAGVGVGRHPRWRHLRRRQGELLDAFGRGWRLADLPADLRHVLPDAAHDLYHRGFVGTVRVDCRTWLDHGPPLVRACPVTRVLLTDRDPARGGRAWAWAEGRDRWGDGVSTLPPALFACLSAAAYPTEAAAVEAASRAALAFARTSPPNPGARPPVALPGPATPPPAGG